MIKRVGGVVRRFVEALASFLLLLIQYVPVIGFWHGVMFYPLAVYIFSLLAVYPEDFWVESNFLLFSSHNIFGRIVAFCGFVLFLAAGVQFLRRRGRLITTGVYSIVRHPQYLGIIVLTFGYAFMVIQVTTPAPIEVAQKVLFIWLVQVVGYIILASYEEHRLSREHGNEYQRYKQAVPFVFPVWHPARIPEPIFSIILSLIVIFLSMLLLVLQN